MFLLHFYYILLYFPQHRYYYCRRTRARITRRRFTFHCNIFSYVYRILTTALLLSIFTSEAVKTPVTTHRAPSWSTFQSRASSKPYVKSSNQTRVNRVPRAGGDSPRCAPTSNSATTAAILCTAVIVLARAHARAVDGVVGFSSSGDESLDHGPPRDGYRFSTANRRYAWGCGRRTSI